MAIFLHILGNNVIPIFLIIALGFIMGKKFKIDIFTLSKFCFYLFTPSFIFVSLYTTDLRWDMLKVAGFGITMFIVCDIIGRIVAKIRNFDVGLTNAFKNSIIFNNSGNIGISLMILIFGGEPFIINGETPYLDASISTQVVVLLIINIGMNTLGFFYAGQAKLKPKDSLKKIFTLPSIYVLPAVLILKTAQIDITSTMVWPALVHLKNGMVPMSLLTLGVQLSRAAFDFKNVNTHISVFIKLAGGPLMALVFINLFGFEGVVAQTLFIAYAVPTAVNTALIAVECENYPDFASQAVMLSTIFSTLTLTLVIYLARIIFPV